MNQGWIRPLLVVTAVAAGVLLSSSAPADDEGGAARAVQAVADLDLDRYEGRWFEVARIPNKYQGDCACCVTATYTLRDDGRLTVVNECRTAEGEPKGVEGEAKLARKEGPSSKLKVRFAPRFLSFLGFVWGDYWVLDLAEDYSHALVGSPDRKYLWVLAREPRLDPETYARLMQEARRMGFDVDRVVPTPQED
jgi:apolipoprotein D and lipocalin family protein